MIMVNLIGILLIGGLLAMISERFGDTMPRKVAMAVVLIDLLYLLIDLLGFGLFDKNITIVRLN